MRFPYSEWRVPTSVYCRKSVKLTPFPEIPVKKKVIVRRDGKLEELDVVTKRGKGDFIFVPSVAHPTLHEKLEIVAIVSEEEETPPTPAPKPVKVKAPKVKPPADEDEDEDDKKEKPKMTISQRLRWGCIRIFAFVAVLVISLFILAFMGKLK